VIKGPCCLNCEEKKITPYPITIDQRSGFICQECYNSNIWAKSQTVEDHSLYSLLKVHFGKKEASQE